MCAHDDEWRGAADPTQIAIRHNDDVFATVEVTIDSTKHVKPLEQAQAAEKEVKFTTISKYTYYEQGDYVKVDLPIGAGADKEKNRIQCDFKDRAFEIRLFDFQGQNMVFGVRKLQCRILPPDCSYRISSKGLQIKLRKKKSEDNWHSLIHSPAIGEVDSD